RIAATHEETGRGHAGVWATARNGPMRFSVSRVALATVLVGCSSGSSPGAGPGPSSDDGGVINLDAASDGTEGVGIDASLDVAAPPGVPTFGAPVSLASNDDEPASLAVDATYLYWTTLGPLADAGGHLPGSIMKM